MPKYVKPATAVSVAHVNGIHTNGAHKPTANGTALPSLQEEVEAMNPLKVFKFHGMDLTEKSGQAYGECPFCGRPKFFVAVETGKWDCKGCLLTGNPITFLRQLHMKSEEETTSSDYDKLAEDRGLVYPETLIHWGVAKSIITNEWLIPGYGVDGKLKQLYRYIWDDKKKRMMLWATPGLTHELHMAGKIGAEKKTVYVCEGPWDGMVLWESMRYIKDIGRGWERNFILTGNPDVSLLRDAAVIAPPGASVWLEKWGYLFKDLDVVLLYDSDHPQKHPKTGKYEPPAGIQGVKRVTSILADHEAKPKTIAYLKWGDEGYDSTLKHGYDVRDILKDKGRTNIQDRFDAVKTILEKVKPIPEGWLVGKRKGLELVPVMCNNWATLLSAWRKAMKLTDGLTAGLTVTLACILSTKTPGSQLWARIIAPASTGKTTIAEAVSVAKKYVVAKSTIRGLHSGFQGSGGSEDNSLITKLYDKTLIIKDADTLIQSPNRDQILSEFRDAYDRVARTSYRNGVNNDHMNVNMTVILYGTNSLRQLDTSELGERFITCSLMEGIDDDLEDEIAWRVINRTINNMKAGSGAMKQEDPSMVKVKQLTAGYIHYLRVNADRLLANIKIDDDYMKLIIKLGKYVAYLRARPSTKQSEMTDREFSARLVEQFVKLAMCVAAVFGKDSVDDEVIKLTRKCALDTARGRTQEIIKFLHKNGEKGLDIKSISRYTGESEDKDRTLLKFLRKLTAVEHFVPEKVKGVPGPPRWKLTKPMYALYEEVIRDV